VVLFFKKEIFETCCISPCRRGGSAGEDGAMRKRNYIKAGRGSWTVRKKRTLIAASILLSLYLLTSLILGEMGLVKYYRMKAQYNALTEEISTLKQDNARLVRDVRALRSDPACIERIARDKLGLARQGEIVYYYGEP
jgi:cell division protein FtsB